MTLDKNWFSMTSIRSSKFSAKTWIPLRANQDIKNIWKYAQDWHEKESFCCWTVTLPVSNKVEALELKWDDIGLHYDDIWPDTWTEEYMASDIYDLDETILWVHLVLSQHIPDEWSEWHLNQDIVLALKLKREGDVWVRPLENYIEVVRLKRDSLGKPVLIEMRAEHLRDYLCARKMWLYITTYYERISDSASEPDFSFTSADQIEENALRFNGSITEIHEWWWMRYGEKARIFHISRTDLNEEDEILELWFPTSDSQVKTTIRDKGFEWRKLYSIMWRLWKNEWLEPAPISPRVKWDDSPSNIYFTTDTSWIKTVAEDMKDWRNWLWFKPEAGKYLSDRRWGILKWLTKDTGHLWCSPQDWVHFWINELGYINVFGKDIAMLPEWQQQEWVWFNVSPDWSISGELLSSQTKAIPAKTKAPENFIEKWLEKINELSNKIHWVSFIREHQKMKEIIKSCNRFRSTSENWLYELAKDLARITADTFDSDNLQSIVPTPKDEKKWWSLKSFEKYIASLIWDDDAKEIFGPLHWIYNLRLADAHMPKSDLDEFKKLTGIETDKPYIIQGYQMIDNCVQVLFTIVKILEELDSK